MFNFLSVVVFKKAFDLPDIWEVVVEVLPTLKVTKFKHLLICSVIFVGGLATGTGAGTGNKAVNTTRPFPSAYFLLWEGG